MNMMSEFRRTTTAARSVSYRSQFPIGPKAPRALKNEEIAMGHFTCSPSKGGAIVVDKQGNTTQKLKELLPSALHAHYDKLRADTRFDRFALFAKSFGNGTTDDGLIVGFANDDMYYVVATWDANGHDIWEPAPGTGHQPMVVWD